MSQESAYFKVSNVNRLGDLKKIKRGIGSLPAVNSISYSKEDSIVGVDFDNTGISNKQIANNLKELGYNIVDSTVKNNHTL